VSQLDFAGDALFFFELRKQSTKPWVARIALPYTIFFAVACAVSLAAVITKVRLVILKLRSRSARRALLHRPRTDRRLSFGGVSIAASSLSDESFKRSESSSNSLKEKFDDQRLHWQLACCHVGSALFEDLPLGK
jgi:hypothetical protein